MRRVAAYIITLIVIPCIVFAAGTFGTQSSSKSTEWGFDFVETFDNLDDWRGNCTGGKIDTNLPQISGGGTGPWDSYDQWDTSCDTGENWIDAHGAAYVWGGTGKSLRMNISGTKSYYPSAGVQRLVMFFGDSTDPDPTTTGYTDFYMFYMLKIHKGQWYTEESGGVGQYYTGNDYGYVGSWKLNSINYGQKAVHTRFDDDSNTYSYHHGTQHIKNGGLANPIRLRTEPNDFHPTYGSGYVGSVFGTTDVVATYGSSEWMEWFGVEFHVQIVNDGGTWYWRQDAWLYDSEGNAIQQWSNNDSEINSYYPTNNHKINEIVLGGNNSSEPEWGITMTPDYYVDDVIINGSRIGPTYFGLQGGGGVGGFNGVGASSFTGEGSSSFQ